MLSMFSRPDTRTVVCRRAAPWALAALLSMLPLEAAEVPAPGLHRHLDAWRAIPILDDGRIMPLDTFARRHVETICNAQEPKLTTGPEGLPIRWHADELLLDWLVRPAAWEDVPFLIAEHEGLRELLGLPVFSDGPGERRRLKHATPADVLESEPLRQRLIAIGDARRTSMAAGEPVRLEGLDAKVDQLWRAYVTFRQLTFRAETTETGRSRFVQLLEEAAGSWRQLRSQLVASDIGKATPLEEIDQGLVAISVAVGESTRFPTAAALSAWEQFSAALQGVEEAGADRLPSALKRGVRRLREKTTVLGESLYDNGGGLLVTPALHAGALETERDAEADLSPWLGLTAVLDAAPSVLTGYPTEKVAAVREAFAALAAVVQGEGRDPADVVAPAARLSAELQSLGTAVEPLRLALTVERPDADLIRYTAYPAAGSTLREVRYNESDPFRMSWVLSFLALGAFAMAFGRARPPMFWLGVALLIAELAWTASAFAARVAITGWAPVTNMYETVIYVPFFLSLLGLFFLLAPACGLGATDAWRLTALPPPGGRLIPGEATPLDERRRSVLGSRGWNAAGWLLLAPRILLAAGVLWILAMAPYAAGGRTIINLLPQTDVDRSLPNLNNLIVWLVGLTMLLPAVWYLPRLVLAAISSFVMVPLSWRGGHLAAALPEVYGRRSFGLVVTAVAFAGTFIAWFFPIPGKQFSPLQPVLRDNFWLTIHVLTIVSSYAAGALAWGLGCLSLGYYLFGRYEPKPTGGKAPPAACSTLANFIYKAMQVAVLLLAAGTILGGLWADVSWGRFWGWDPKEVWALVSLLAYMIVLHGRYAGWIGNFGLAAGSVLGAAVIGMSWYGVNFLLGAGLHSYGFGQGGQTEFFSFLVLNLLFLVAAGWRWRRETRPAVAAAATPSFDPGIATSGHHPQRA
jgi:ABC-type transport system involved in cytochrome c biogenesis permease subunit